MSKPTIKSKADLMVALKKLLQERSMKNQEEIKRSLDKQGFIINQVSISRMLHKIGATKIINEHNQAIYSLPPEQDRIAPRDSLKHLILNIAHNEYLIVIQTIPGSAQLLARLLDQKKTLGILGTVAGDDTIFITPLTTKALSSTYDKIRKLLLG